LPAELRSRVALVGLLGLQEQASFEFHVAGWLGVQTGHHLTVPEVARLETTPVLCLRGEDEADSACRLLRGAAVRTVTLPGGHHFGGDYERIAETVLSAIRSAGPSPGRPE
jgi:type IV secretory pathway VirJ component